MISHDEYKELAVAHALDALETAEARAIEDHLTTCKECRVDFDAWKETASSLAFAAGTADPSAALRTRVLQQARSHADSELKRGNDSIEGVTNKDAERSSNVIPMPATSRYAWIPRQAFGTIAASLLIVLLTIALVLLWQRNGAMETEMARLSRQVNESQKELTRLREEKGLLTAPDARVASLAGTEMAKGAHAMLAYNRVTGRAMLIANGLPPVPAGKVYQLWFIMEGKPPMPGSVFATDAAGHAELRQEIPLEGRNATTYVVTLERAGGVPAPEGKAYLQGSAS